MPTSVRLDSKTEGMVSRLARKTGLTKSEIIRKAVGVYVAGRGQAEVPLPPYEAMAHLIGSVGGGPKDLSERTGERFRKLLLTRKRR